MGIFIWNTEIKRGFNSRFYQLQGLRNMREPNQRVNQTPKNVALITLFVGL